VFYPRPPETPRLQYLTHLSGSEDAAQKRGGFERLVFGERQDADEVVKPYGVAIHDGTVYVCDSKRNLVNVFNLKQGKFGSLGFKNEGALTKPINIAVDDGGHKYVADASRSEVVVFDDTDTYLRAFGGEDLARPVDLAAFGDKIFVCDAEACQIVVFDRARLQYLYRFGEKGTAEGQFARPTNIAVDRDGNLYISDTINGRIQKCDPQGQHLMTIGKLGDGLGQFARPKGVAVDRENRLYVVDAAFENVQIFDPEGRLLLFFSEAGNQPGQLNLPAQVVIDYDNVTYFEQYAGEDFDVEYLVLVTSQYGPRKVNVFGFGQPRASP
jgi:DNA-binding beta-propeller fold protein YncE